MTGRVDVLRVMEFCSKGFVNGSSCTHDLLAARAAVAELIEAANNLRVAQRAYMADRGNETKGRIVAVNAGALDAALARIGGDA